MGQEALGAAEQVLIGEFGLRDIALVPVVDLELDPLPLLEAEVDAELVLPARVRVVVDLLRSA